MDNGAIRLVEDIHVTYYKCKKCGFITFVLSDMNCKNCGKSYVMYDKHMKVLRNQSVLEDYIDS